MTFKYNDMFKNLFILFISVIVSFFISINSSNIKKRNDLVNYSNYYTCLEDFNSNCSSLIGNPIDIAFSYTAMFSKFFLHINNFYIFIFLYSFCILYLILYFTSNISPLNIISITFLLTDFRFYEYASNILRVGLSLVLLLSIFNYIVKKNNFPFLYKILPAFAHITAFIAIIAPKFKISIYFLVISFIIFFAFSFYFDIIYEYFKGFLPTVMFDKTYYYYNLAKVNKMEYIMPLHYFFIIFLSIIMRNKINDATYIYSFNIVWFLFLASLVLHSFNMEYRMLAIMPPFLSILLAYQVKYILEIKENLFHKMSIIILFLLFFLFLFYKNFNAIIRGLS